MADDTFARVKKIIVEQLGVEGHAAIVQWSGVTFGATFFSAALVAPLWGRLAA